MTLDELKLKARAGDAEATKQVAFQLDQAGRGAEATDFLAELARQGNSQARFLIGVRLLFGFSAPTLPAEGIQFISEAADMNNVDALAWLAVLTGAGAYVPRDPAKALDLLYRSAELGRVLSQRQLALLGGMPKLAREGALPKQMPAGTWRRLRDAIDVAAWTSPPEIQTLSESPLVGAIETFVSEPICDWFLQRSRGRLVRAQTYNSLQGSEEVSGIRTNTIAFFNLGDADLVSLMVQARIAAVVGQPFSHMEGLAVLHYSPGEEFANHYDFIDPETPNYQQEIARNGERIVTFLIYLNEDYEGGETDFPRLGFSHKGKRGGALFVHNADAAGRADTRTLHAGRPPTTGEKWIITQFVRNRPAIPGSAASP